MMLSHKLRDLLVPRKNILKDVGIQKGFHVLDYGCGGGGYVAATAELVGQSGKVYALDIHPLAIQKVQELALKKQLTNVQTIRSDCRTGLADGSLDVVLLYDTFHALSDPNRILRELHRVLKPNGFLSFSDHHLREAEILSYVTDGGLFAFSRKCTKTYSFART
jgi:ubiquinone/menaquinone biosynthesis C-methylase UbiE